MPRCVIRMALSVGLLAAVLGLPPASGNPVSRPPALAWSFDIHDDRRDSPHGRVFLCVNGSKVLVLPRAGMHYSLVPRSEYHERNVPAAALTACSGWWAGAGVDLYVVQYGGRLNVFRRDEDEQSGNSAYRLIKSVPFARL